MHPLAFSQEDFRSLLSSPPLLDNLFAHLNITDIIRVSWTCLGARTAVQKFLKRAYNFDRHFAHFFHDTHGFRQLLARTGAVVSGSNALQYLERIYWPGSDLDMYTYISEAAQIAAWLKTEHYEYVPKDGQPVDINEAINHKIIPRDYVEGLEMSGLRNVLDFIKGEHKVQVLICFRGSISDVILGFHSTCVMNAITHKAAYCLYPRLTLDLHKTLCFSPYNMYRLDPFIKYEGRGWAPFTWWNERMTPHKAAGIVPNISRLFGDATCWTPYHNPPLEGDLDVEDTFATEKFHLQMWGIRPLLG